MFIWDVNTTTIKHFEFHYNESGEEKREREREIMNVNAFELTIIWTNTIHKLCMDVCSECDCIYENSYLRVFLQIGKKKTEMRTKEKLEHE